MIFWDVEGLGTNIRDGEVAIQIGVVGEAGETTGNDLNIGLIGILQGSRQFGAVGAGVVEDEFSGARLQIPEAIGHHRKHVVRATVDPLEVVVKANDQGAIGFEGQTFWLVEQGVDALFRQVEQGGLVHLRDDAVHQG